jgi:hypothetical protein
MRDEARSLSFRAYDDRSYLPWVYGFQAQLPVLSFATEPASLNGAVDTWIWMAKIQKINKERSATFAVRRQGRGGADEVLPSHEMVGLRWQVHGILLTHPSTSGA